MKKIISTIVVIMFAMFFISNTVHASDEETPVFSLDTVSGGSGDTVCLNLAIENNPGITALQLQIGYPAENLELLSVKDTKLLEDAISYGQQSANPYTISWFSSKSKNVYKNGTFATLEFRIRNGAKTGDVTIQYDQENVFDISLVGIPFRTRTGKVIVAEDLEADASFQDNKGNTYRVLSENSVEYVKPADNHSTKVNIPAFVQKDGIRYKVTAIADRAFHGDKKLKTVTIGTNVESIGKSAFYNCKSLKKITIPAKVKKIGMLALANCKKLSSIKIKSKKLKAASVGKMAFFGGLSKPVITTPKAYRTLYKKVLKAKGMSKYAVYRS